jgi:hypothetical protein
MRSPARPLGTSLASTRSRPRTRTWEKRAQARRESGARTRTSWLAGGGGTWMQQPYSGTSRNSVVASPSPSSATTKPSSAASRASSSGTPLGPAGGRLRSPRRWPAPRAWRGRESAPRGAPGCAPGGTGAQSGHPNPSRDRSRRSAPGTRWRAGLEGAYAPVPPAISPRSGSAPRSGPAPPGATAARR